MQVSPLCSRMILAWLKPLFWCGLRADKRHPGSVILVRLLDVRANWIVQCVVESSAADQSPVRPALCFTLSSGECVDAVPARDRFQH